MKNNKNNKNLKKIINKYRHLGLIDDLVIEIYNESIQNAADNAETKIES